jgi:hypothetical protein
MGKIWGSAEKTDQECRMIPRANALVKPQMLIPTRRQGLDRVRRSLPRDATVKFHGTSD